MKKTIVQAYCDGEIEDRYINKWLEEAIIHWDGGDGSLAQWQYLGFSTEADYVKWSGDFSYMQTLKKQYENNKSKLATSR